MEKIDLITRLNCISKVEESHKELYDMFNSIPHMKHLIMPCILKKGIKIIRLRINEGNYLYMNKSEISYPPSECVRDYGRANIPGNPMFYGAIHSGGEIGKYSEVTVLTETSSLLENNDWIGTKRLTYSVWTTMKDLNLIALPFSEGYKKPCDEIISFRKQWDNEQKKYDINDQTLRLKEYMSNEIKNRYSDPKDYFMIANYIYFMLDSNNDTQDFDGILYPSTSIDGNGLNIALKPKSVDHDLKFEGGVLCEFKREEKGTSYLYPIKDIKETNHSGDFEYSIYK